MVDPNAPHPLVVKGLTSAEVESLNAMTDKRNADLARQGLSTSRNSLVVAALRSLISAG